MKTSLKFLPFLGLFLLGCEFTSPYQITFTTPEDKAVDPLVDTLDFAVNQATLAYLSSVTCEGANKIELLPVASADAVPSTAHNLSLTVLKDQLPETECKVSVTVYDRTTTSTASKSIDLVIEGELEELLPEVEVDVEAKTEVETETETETEVEIEIEPLTSTDAPTEPSPETPSE